MRDVYTGTGKPDEESEAVDPRADGFHEAYERYRALSAHAGDVLAEITEQGHFLYVSDSVQEAFGYRPDELIGRPGLDLVHEDDLSELNGLRAEAMVELRPVQLRFRLRHQQGTWRWVELTARPYRTESGELRAVCVGRDVTERVEAERALQEQLRIERRIVDVATRLLTVSGESIDGAVDHALGVSVELAWADCIQFVMLDPECSSVLARYQWCADGVDPIDGEHLRLAGREFRWASAKLELGEVIHVPSASHLPPEARTERAFCEESRVRSLLALPIRHDGRTVGFVDFFRFRREEGWSDQDVARLRLLTEVVGSALQRLHAERTRRDSEERFRRLTEHARDTICEMSFDGRLLYASAGFTELSGFSREELATTDPWSLVHPGDVERIRAAAAKQIQAGESVLLTCRIRHRDGSWRWLEATLSRFETPSGEPRVAVVVRDVTGRENERAELERQLAVERRLGDFSRSLFEQGADEIDAGIRHGLGEAAALAGADRAYLVTALGGAGSEAASYDWHAPDVPPRPYKTGSDGYKRRWVAKRLFRGEVVRVPRVGELPEEARDSREILEREGVCSYLGIPINAEDRLLGVLGFHCIRGERDWSERDLTLLRLVADLFAGALRRKSAELSLRESQGRLLQGQKMEAIGTLAGGIAHDFNNQLTVILANTRYAMRNAPADGDVLHALADLDRAAEHCAQLTRSLLAFSRRSPGAPRPLCVREVAAEAVELLRPLIPSSIDLQLEPGDEGLRVVADPTQLQQVLVNLVINARDAMPDGGRLVLHTSARELSSAEAARLELPRPGEYVEFAVRDSGVGLDEATLARIFEPFFTTKPPGQGTGLGLATAYGIVRECGGAIDVESQPGAGSTFRVLLPRAAAATGEGAAVAEPRSGLGVVLLAEDEDGVRRIVARTLREAGYEVVEARDGEEAAQLAAARPDGIGALVTDIDMPRLGGVQLARRLARSRADLPVLFISGTQLPPPEPRSPLRRTRFLQKPFADESLLEALGALLDESSPS